MDLFEQDMRRRIRQKTFDKLKLNRADDLPMCQEEIISQYIDQAIRQIDLYDGVLTDDLYRYVVMMLDFGSDFYAEKWAAEVFEDPEIPGRSKLDVLDVYAKARKRNMHGA